MKGPAMQVATIEGTADKAPAVRQSSAVTPMQMLQMAVERGADVAMLEKLMALQERWEASEARKAFVVALSAFKANPPTITKNKHVSFPNSKGGQTDYDHATLDQVANVIGAALSQHGMSHRWETEQGDGGMIRVTCILQHVLGHSERVTLQSSPDQSGGKNNIQAVGSTVSYLQRYTLLAATGLAARDMDDDAERGGAGALISADEKQQLVDLLKETGADVKKYLAYLGVPTLDDLPLAKFADAKVALLKKKAAAQ